MTNNDNKKQYNLAKISQTAKTDLEQATTDILSFVKAKFTQIEATSIEINQSKVSLNSVNGFINTVDNKRYFFKFHAEEGDQNTIDEYYQSYELEKAGLPMVKPIYENTEPGSQFLIYAEITAKTAFDEFTNLEENNNLQKEEQLLNAEGRLLKIEAQVFLDTLKLSDAKEIASTPLYQLFHTRLVSKNNEPPRLDIYYTGQEIELPNGEKINFDDLAQKKWIINEIEYSENLLAIINSAKDILDPLKTEQIPTVLGHGDDHNGNKFFIDNDFIFFDPAFAGRQPALLSFVKATAHNTFLHPNWLYDPAKTKDDLEFSYEITDETIIVNHNWDMALKSPVREKILNLQIEKVWQPLIAEFKKRDILPQNYKEYIRKALFCCPFLVYNLIDKQKYSSTESLLALSKCVELGTAGNKENYIDEFLEKIN